jgi:CRISPR-associated endonuclease Cas3-HD
VPVDDFYARTREGIADPGAWQTLVDHLQGVARLAESFAGAFNSSQWGHLAGLWHDLGKYRAEFQARLRGALTTVEHSGVGAALACHFDRDRGAPVVFERYFRILHGAQTPGSDQLR